jgi:hypothetical protein
LAASSAVSAAPFCVDPEVGAVLDVLAEVDVGDEVVEVGSANDVGADWALRVGPSSEDSATAVPAVTASAPAAMAPTSSFLVMSVPFPCMVFSGTDHDAEPRPSAALPEG